MTFAKRYQRTVVARYGDRTPNGDRLIPVVYVTLPDDCRTKWLDLAICEFCAIQLPSQPTKDDLVLLVARGVHSLGLWAGEGDRIGGRPAALLR